MDPHALTGNRFASLLLVPLALAACSDRAVPDRLEVDLDSLPVAIDLAAALPLGLARAETLAIDFGAPEARQHLIDGWARDEVWQPDGVTVVWGLGEGSTLRFEIFEPRELEATFRCRPMHWRDGPRQELTVRVNGREVERYRLRRGFREYRLTMPAEALRIGENTLKFDYGFSRTPKELDATSLDTRKLAVAWEVLRILPEDRGPLALDPGAISVPSGDVDSIFLPFGSEIAFFLEVPAISYLSFGEVEAERGRGRLVVRTRFARPQASGDTSRETDAAYRLRTVTVPSRGDVVAVKGARPGLVEIGLLAVSEGPVPGGIRVHAPVLHHARPASVGVAQAPASAGDRGRPNVIIYLVDALRADHLGCYGYPRPVSPNIDAFAREAILFERSLANASWTRSAVASVMTGKTPLRHGVLGDDDALPQSVQTLAEILRDHGYLTAGFQTNGHAGAAFGFDQGFDEYQLVGAGSGESRSDDVNDAVFEWLERQDGERPLFLYVHTIDPHGPYWPTPEAAARFASHVEQPSLNPESAAALTAMISKIPDGVSGDLNRLGSVAWIRALQAGTIPPSEAITRDLIALYDAEIFSNDLNFGRFIDSLKSQEIYEDSLVFFVADHGEEFLDHGGWSHGRTLFAEQLHVPLILKPPAESGAPRGWRERRLGQQIDIVPTVLRYLGLPLPAQIEGRDLLRGLGTPVEDDPVAGFSYLELRGITAASLVAGRWKILCPTLQASTCRLFDLETDPGETLDLWSRRPVIAGSLLARMRPYATAPMVEAPRVVVDSELHGQLKALGYL